MAKKIAKTPASVVTINRSWQLVYIGSMLAAQIVAMGWVVWTMLHYGAHLSGGFFVFQLAQWGLPVLFAVISLMFVWRRIQGLVPRLFWAIFLATIGTVLYTAASVSFTYIVNFSFSPAHGTYHRPWWSTDTWQLTQTGIGLVLFSLGLGFAAWKGKRH